MKSSSRTGLAIHASNVAMTSSRAVTSHLRKRYREKYHGRYRFARAVFAFDLILLGVALGLLVLNAVMFTAPAETPSGLDLSLKTRGLVAGDVMPVEASLRVTDGETHENVRLTWLLPPWIEVLRADPPLSSGNSVLLGRVTGAEDVRSRLYVRIRATPGTAVPFAFRVQEGEGDVAKIFTGSESRKVMSSAIVAEPATPVDAVAPGATVPILVSNRGTLEAPAVIVRLLTKDGALQSVLGENGEAKIGVMAPGESHMIFLDVDPAAAGKAEFVWEVQDAARPLSVHPLNVPVVASTGIVVESLTSLRGSSIAEVAYRAEHPGNLLVIHPAQLLVDGKAFGLYPVTPGTGRIRVPLDAARKFSDATWSVIPIENRGDMVFGRRRVGTLSAILPFTTAARYYAVGGDQLGVGPLPPRIGETTSYWIVWSVGPSELSFRNLEMKTRLGRGVAATGRYASAASGEFSTDGTSVTWTAPDLSATGADPMTFAFEIAYTPSADDVGKTPTLIEESFATAIEDRTGSIFAAISPEQTTDLKEDAQASGKGRVE